MVDALRIYHGQDDLPAAWFEARANTPEEAAEMAFQENAARMEARVKRKKVL